MKIFKVDWRRYYFDFNRTGLSFDTHCFLRKVFKENLLLRSDEPVLSTPPRK